MTDDLFRRIRNTAPQFIPVEQELPSDWHDGFPQCNHPLEEYRFRVQLSDGKLYWSYWINGGWRVTQLNPKFSVTHWVKPIWIG